MRKIWKWIRNLFLGILFIIGGLFAGPTIYHAIIPNEPLSGTSQSLLWSCDFSVDGCGFDLAPVGGVLNVSSTTRRDLNLSIYTWTNFSYDLYCPNTATLFKHQIVDASGSDKWYWENCGAATCDVKSEDAYETAGTFPSTGYTTVWIATNRTSNTSTIMWTGKSGGPFTTTAGTFTMVAGANYTELTKTSSGSDCLVDNMYLYVLTSEIGGESSNASPVISEVTSGTITYGSAIITWTTNISSNTSVNYGVTIGLGTQAGTNDAVTSHSQPISSLTNNTLYYYNVTSCNTGGNCSTDGPYNFTTLNTSYSNITCIYNATFATTAENWTGGTLNTSQTRYEGKTGNDLYLSGINLNLGSFPFVNITTRIYWLSNNTRSKFYYDANNGSLSGNRLLSEWQTGSSDYVLKPEPVYTPQKTGVTANAWHSLSLIKNTTATNKFTFIIDGTSNSVAHTIAGGNYFNIEVGTGGNGIYLTNITVCVLGTADTIPPVITSGPSVINITDGFGIIYWTTDESSTSSVNYGTTTALGSSGSGSSGTTHYVSISGLTYGTLYYYNVTSCDANNNCVSSGPNTFTTYGQISITHNTPSGNVIQNQFFTYNDTVSCLGGLQNTSCGNVSIYLDPIVQDSDTCFQSMNCSTAYDRYLQGYQIVRGGDVPTVITTTYGGVNILLIPWFGKGPNWDTCYPDNIHLTSCGLSGTASSTNFCQVTDEFSQYGLMLSMSHNTTLLNAQAGPYLNTIKLINATQAKESRNLGNGTFWILGYNAGTVTFSDRTTATDADARIIISLFNLANNSYYTDTAKKTEMRNYALTMCQSLKDTGVNTVDHPSSIDGHTVHYWYTGSGTNSFSSDALGCWSDWIGLGGANYKDINITVSQG